jgi:CheY-like chemotaxis protein
MHADYDVLTQVRPREALSMALTQQPDLVAIDVRLHGETAGFEATAKIRGCADVPFVFLTRAQTTRSQPVPPIATDFVAIARS